MSDESNHYQSVYWSQECLKSLIRAKSLAMNLARTYSSSSIAWALIGEHRTAPSKSLFGDGLCSQQASAAKQFLRSGPVNYKVGASPWAFAVQGGCAFHGSTCGWQRGASHGKVETQTGPAWEWPVLMKLWFSLKASESHTIILLSHHSSSGHMFSIKLLVEPWSYRGFTSQVLQGIRSLLAPEPCNRTMVVSWWKKLGTVPNCTGICRCLFAFFPRVRRIGSEVIWMIENDWEWATRCFHSGLATAVGEAAFRVPTDHLGGLQWGPPCWAPTKQIFRELEGEKTQSSVLPRIEFCWQNRSRIFQNIIFRRTVPSRNKKGTGRMALRKPATFEFPTDPELSGKASWSTLLLQIFRPGWIRMKKRFDNSGRSVLFVSLWCSCWFLGDQIIWRSDFDFWANLGPPVFNCNHVTGWSHGAEESESEGSKRCRHDAQGQLWR